jgi:hypothetical protein
VLICEEGIYVLETQSTLYVPQTIGTRNVIMGNRIVAKPNLYCINYHRTNHNVETCRSKKREEPTIAITTAIIQASKAPRPLNCPCHICGIVGHKLMKNLKSGEMQNMFKDKESQTTKSKPTNEVKVITA